MSSLKASLSKRATTARTNNKVKNELKSKTECEDEINMATIPEHMSRSIQSQGKGFLAGLDGQPRRKKARL